MCFLIGIDDTDNKETRGTGFRARGLGELLRTKGLNVTGITRHQLLVDPRIPYTTHNSSACLVVNGPAMHPQELFDVCRAFLVQEGADGSDAGLCLVSEETALTIKEFAQQAKNTVLTQATAFDLAQQENILLEGLTGDGGGVIGALAAVGLRAGGNDGRFIWLAGVRELEAGLYTAGQLYHSTGIQEICSLGGDSVPPSACIDIGAWPRPILRQGRAVLLVERANGHHERPCNWHVAPKEVIKRYSS